MRKEPLGKMSFTKAVVFFCCFVALSHAACYPPCGCFTDDPPFEDRPVPQSYQDQEIAWLLFTRSNPNNPQNVHWDSPIKPPAFDPNKRTVYVIHGWTDNFVRQLDIKDAFLQQGDYNVVVVDWETGASSLFYPLAASNTRVVGACTAHIAEYLGDNFGDHYCVGHSLGAQTCGYMGKATGGQLGRITGLDPAGPWFETNDIRVRLDKSDCLFMDNIHTEIAFAGIGMSVGHVDFFPNNGREQPPCYGPEPPIIGGCDHSVCKNYLIISLIEDDCKYESYPCDSEQDANNGHCNTCVPGETCQSMGFHSEQLYLDSGGEAEGRYYLTTSEIYPYCS